MIRILGVFVFLGVFALGTSGFGQEPEAPPKPEEQPKGESFRIDGVHSSAHFRVQHMGVSMFYGRFNAVEGKITTDESGKLTMVEVTIPIESIDTGSEKLDRHLRSPDFFDVENHPAMKFTSSEIKEVKAGHYDVTGELQIRETKKTITARVEQMGMSQTPRGKKCGFESTLTIKRSDFGLTYGIENGAIGDETRIILSVEAGVGGGRRGGGRGGRGGRGGPEGMLQRFDANKDGKLQIDEVPQRMADMMFGQFDKNGDDVLDAEELKAMSESFGGGRGGRGGGRGGRGGGEF